MYASEFLDSSLLDPLSPLTKEKTLTPNIGEARQGIQQLLEPVLNAIQEGQPIHEILVLGTVADRKIQDFRRRIGLRTRAQEIAALTAAPAAKQKSGKSATALVAEASPLRGDSKDQERKALEKRIVQDCLRSKPSANNKVHAKNACIKYCIARMLDDKSHDEAADICKRNCKPGSSCNGTRHLHILPSVIRTENERAAAAKAVPPAAPPAPETASLDAQD